MAIDGNDLAPNYTLRGRVENFEAASASAAVFGAPVLSGRSTLVLDVASNGETPGEVMRRLSGKASLAMPEGGRLALDVKVLRGAAKAEVRWVGAGSAKVRPASSRSKRARSRNGMLITETVQARSGAGSIAASGRVDLAERTLDLHVQ